MGAEAATKVLEAAGVTFELLPHAPTESALAEAGALGVSGGEVAKTVVLTTAQGYVRAVLPASERLDLRKVRELVGEGKPVRLASESELARDYPEFDLGAIPPFAGQRREPVLVDRNLVGRESVVLEAGSKTASVRLQTGDLVRLTGARVHDICEE
jgi:Ala-tRNA(Pro) deacylase